MLNDAPEQVIIGICVRKLAEAVPHRCFVERFVIPEPTCLIEQHSNADLGRYEVFGSIIARRGIKIDFSLLNKLHNRNRAHRLAQRANIESVTGTFARSKRAHIRNPLARDNGNGYSWLVSAINVTRKIRIKRRRKLVGIQIGR